MKPFASAVILALGLALPLTAQAVQPTEPQAPTDPLPPVSDPLGQPPSTPPPSSVPPYVPPVTDAATPSQEPQSAPPPRDEEPAMSEGRRIVAIWNTGFQWGIAPGLIFSGGKASFALGLRFGYGFDTGTFILVPGVRLVGYFSTPGVYMGMPIMKLVLPIDRFAPFVEAGAGIGYLSSGETGLAVLGGGGFMIHFTMKFGLGVEANYQVITGTDFKGFGIGPILALAF